MVPEQVSPFLVNAGLANVAIGLSAMVIIGCIMSPNREGIMDASEKAHVDALKTLGLLKEEGEIPRSPGATVTLIEKLAEALRRAVASAPSCPYCDTPTYLRRHQEGCGINRVLEDAKAWLGNRE